MGMYASVRGWLEADRLQRAAVEAVIEDARTDLYSGGWAFPERPFNWALYVFYGGDIREAGLPWLRAQVETMAALPPADDDGDMPVGLFVISDERSAVSVWDVRDGTVRDRPAPDLQWVSRELTRLREARPGGGHLPPAPERLSPRATSPSRLGTCQGRE